MKEKTAGCKCFDSRVQVPAQVATAQANMAIFGND